ncbi:MAG TPA: nucleoside monophosphate kinase [Candidatus Paceibacterota bacterium]|nr:nucleoside monophosphate kinase [Candidatus Paceibacterota bacterium]HMO82701.1 nucleoside monophosphate kinase [Candidatus Paceibacterota bacterium]
MQPYTVIFIGPQGSGKGTQISKLDSALSAKDPLRQVVDIQTGRRFRALAAQSEGYTEEHVNETLDSGILQPLFLSVHLWGDAMRTHVDEDCHLLIDGFPRIVAEATVLESALNFYQRRQVSIINLVTPEEVVRARMMSRARGDDTPASIEARLTWYREETLPVIQYYKQRPDTAVFDIDGTDTIDGVHAQIISALKL